MDQIARYIINTSIEQQRYKSEKQILSNTLIADSFSSEIHELVKLVPSIVNGTEEIRRFMTRNRYTHNDPIQVERPIEELSTLEDLDNILLT